MQEGTKQCSKCNLTKSLTEFNKEKRRSDGHNNYCRTCSKQYHFQNKKTHNEKAIQNYIENKLERNKKSIEYQEKNKEWLSHYYKTYRKEKYKVDINFKLQLCVRSRIRYALKTNQKSTNTMKLLGCSIEELKQHLEKQFKEGMSWDNHGFDDNNWNIDHIIPCASFDFTKEEEQRKCFHYTNLQPMWSLENKKKGDKII